MTPPSSSAIEDYGPNMVTLAVRELEEMALVAIGKVSVDILLLRWGIRDCSSSLRGKICCLGIFLADNRNVYQE